MTFVFVALTDSKGVVKMLEDRIVTVEISGAGEIAAIGSGNPITEESFSGSRYTSWKGRLGFYVRSKRDAGEIKIRAFADGTEQAELTLIAR